jgi:hypothetical protein
MKTKNVKQSWNRLSLGIAMGIMTLSMLLASFSKEKGGDYFEIYLNNRLVVQQVLHSDKNVKQLSLQQSNYRDQLKVVYSECGRIGQERKITIKDGQNRVLKQWSFVNGTETAKEMTVNVKDILDLKKGDATLQLVYSSRELPKGQVLASIATPKTSVATTKTNHTKP